MNEMIEYTGERNVWQDPGGHLKEFALLNGYYQEAMQHAKGKSVVDTACGTGFGSFLLSLVAKKVVGFDVKNMESAWFPLRDASPNHLGFRVLDLEKKEVPTTEDLAVSIETIEHLANPDFFLAGLKAQSLFFTVPCYGNKNEFHKIEYNEQSCKELITRHFPRLEYRMDRQRMVGIAHKV